MLAGLAEVGVDLKFVSSGGYEGPPRRRGDERAWLEDGELVALDSRGNRRVLATEIDGLAYVTWSDTHVLVHVRDMQETRLFRRWGASFREVELPDFGLAIFDAALVDGVLVVRLFDGPDGDEQPGELEARLDDMRIVLVGHDLATKQDRWEWEYAFDGGLLEPWILSPTHVYEPQDSSFRCWSVRARDGRVVNVDPSLRAPACFVRSGAIFRRATTGLALWDEDACAVVAHIVHADASALDVTALDGDRVLVHNVTSTTLFDAATRRAIAGNAHPPMIQRTASAERANSRWTVRAKSHDALAIEPLDAALAPYWTAAIARVGVPATALERHSASIAEPIVDVERWAAIRRVLADEGNAIESARERLMSQGILGADFDPRAIRVVSKLGAAYSRWWTRFDDDPNTKRIWATIAHDEPRVRAAMALVDEHVHRRRQFEPNRPSLALVFATSLGQTSQFDRIWVRNVAGRMLADVTFNNEFDVGDSDLGTAPSDFVARAQSIWEFAVERALVVPDGYDPALTGVPFAALRSPFEPLLELAKLGYGLRALHEAVAVTLPLFSSLDSNERPSLTKRTTRR